MRNAIARRRRIWLAKSSALTVSVPRPCGWWKRISRTTRRTWRRPFFGRDVLLDAVGEENQADLVAVADGGEGQDAGEFGGQFALALRGRTEIARRADIHEQQDGQFAFLGEFFHERAAGAGGDVPVNRPHFVAGDVFAHLVEVHAPAFEDRVVFAGKRVVDQPACADFELPHPAQDDSWLFLGFILVAPFQVCRRVHGTGSVSRIFWMMSSEVMFSASAS